MSNRNLEETLAFLELLSSVLTIQLIMSSRFGIDGGSFLEEDYRGEWSVEERLRSIERRLSRLEDRLGIR